MSGLDALERRAREATGIAVHAPRVQAPARPRVKADIKTVPVQTAAPFGGSPGAVTVGYYSVQDEVVVMLDQDGSPTGKRHPLSAGEDPRQVAYRLTREAWQAKAPDFSRGLNYQPLGSHENEKAAGIFALRPPRF